MCYQWTYTRTHVQKVQNTRHADDDEFFVGFVTLSFQSKYVNKNTFMNIDIDGG